MKNSGSKRIFNKLQLTMKLTTILLLIGCLQVSAHGYSQRVTISQSNAPLEKIFSEIRQQTGYLFFYNVEWLKKSKPVDIDVKNIPIEEALEQCFNNQPLSYTIVDKTVVLKLKEMAPTPPDPIFIRGKITSKSGEPLVGVTIAVKGASKGTYSDTEGNFLIRLAENDKILVFSCIGMKSLELKLRGNTQVINIIMEEESAKLEEMVFTGIYTRKKDSFSGAATSFTGDQLKAVGNKNVLESLKSLDPSFIKVENNIQGSNPNALPTYEIRGKTTISTANLNSQFNNDPNQPLFILDGFESTLQAIYDLDINRIASITLLKDAASTALYGSKAANGVVVVETKRPTPGQLRVNYTGDFSVEMPDLSSYNLMNSTEKLQYEKLAGLYSNKNDLQWLADEIYSRKIAEIQRGVDTYWLGEPVRTGVTNKHSFQFSGGNNDLLFNAGLYYANQVGVMKGSGRKPWNANINLTYRKGKINISNQLSISGYNGNESPYGSLTEFARANPYYRKHNSDGTISKYLDTANNVINPLWNASLNSINENKGFSFNDNIQAIYSISNNLRLQGGLQIMNQNTSAVVFSPPDNSAFDGVDIHQKGSYTNNRIENRSYSGNLMLTYAKLINKHQINANIRADIGESHSQALGFSAVGFPYGTNGNPIFAYSYTPYGKPVASTVTSRSTGFLASINYSYDGRFMLDAIYRLDGSSVFGSNRMFRPFASGGIGWNIKRESFLKRVDWIDMLKLRADIGMTGNENLGQFTSVSTYTSTTDMNYFGIGGLKMMSLGNPDLEWQKTLQESYGIDFTLLASRISGYLEYYNKKTDPLLVPAAGTLPSSAGVNSNYVMNVGYLTTKGWSANLRLSPIYNLQKRIILTFSVTGSTYNSIYGGLGNKLEVYNTEQMKSNGLLRYKDGYSPDDVWAVVSRGIDPATGREIFQKQDGTFSFDYDTEDIVKVGNTRPKAEGVINVSFTYKDFTIGANIRYVIGAYIYNSALYNKVEQITNADNAYNHDKRALYERWQKPGDIAQFKAIGSNYNTSAMSSRFIQKDSHFNGESFNIGWRVSNGWIERFKLQSLNINFYLNDIFRIESVKSERGINYPFSRSASLSINASF